MYYSIMYYDNIVFSGIAIDNEESNMAIAE